MAGRPESVNILIKALVVAYMAMIVSWTLPDPPPAVRDGRVQPSAAQWPDALLKANFDFKRKNEARHVISALGLWQYWDMFAPNPATLDLWFDAIVTFEDGSTRIQPYPRVKTMPIPEKYFKERYRKFTERVNDEVKDTWKWPTFAQRMALLAYRETGKRPVEVQLRRHWRRIPPPDKPLPTQYNEYIFYKHIVDQAKLTRDAGK